MFIMSNLEFSFKHPTTIQISGMTGCGKTRLLFRILQHQLIRTPEGQFPKRIIWAFSEWQPDYADARALYPHIEFVSGWQEDLYDRLSPGESNLLILDDLMAEAGDSKSMKALFTKGAHHRNCTVIYLLQNLYHQGKSQRTASLNTHYNIVFQNKRDQSQFRTLASQMHPGEFSWLLDALQDATVKPFGYLVIDNHPRTTDESRQVLTGILPDEELTYYCRKNSINTLEGARYPDSISQWARDDQNQKPTKSSNGPSNTSRSHRTRTSSSKQSKKPRKE